MKVLSLKKVLAKNLSTFFFVAKLFFIILEYSGTHFDLVASKVGAKLVSLNIYRDILVNFQRILSTKSTISQKWKIYFSFVSAHCVSLMKI